MPDKLLVYTFELLVIHCRLFAVTVAPFIKILLAFIVPATSNLYLGVEASITDYDSVTATQSTSANGLVAGTTKNITADVKVAQGTVTLGYKF